MRKQFRSSEIPVFAREFQLLCELVDIFTHIRTCFFDSGRKVGLVQGFLSLDLFDLFCELLAAFCP